jgi:hypothetical protein
LKIAFEETIIGMKNRKGFQRLFSGLDKEAFRPLSRPNDKKTPRHFSAWGF